MPELRANRFALAEHMRTVFFVTVEEHIKPEDVLNPGFWLHVAGQVRPYDEITIANDDCSWRMELVVADVWHHGVRVIELNRVQMAGQEQEDKSVGDDLKVRWRGPVNKWCVVRSDGVIMRGGLETKNAALENLTALASERVG